jgi:hypothetical protein
MRHPFRHLLLSVLLLALLSGCGGEEKKPASGDAPRPQVAGEAGKQVPPAPPLRETFDGEPQLSLFPRVAGYRPEDADREGLAYWNTFIEHLVQVSGPVSGAGRDGSRAWSIRSLEGLDSIGFFSPLAVEPGRSYRVTFLFRGDLPQGATAGIGVLEFDQFLWIGDQFTETMLKEHQTGASEGVRLSGSQGWAEHAFTFTVSPRTRMIHLVLFRDGTGDRKQPVLFDDIRIEPAGG